VLHGSYDPLVETLSVVIAVAASYASLDLGDRVTASKGRWFAAWLVGGSLAMGVGIWSMHFTGMLGFTQPIPVSHDLPSALLSYIVAALAALLALWVVSRRKMSSVRAMGSGVLMGGGIAGLHYMDMAGMRMAAECRFNPLLVALSVAFAITFSCVALRLTFHFRNTTKFVLRKIGSALVMGAAICAMHYTGMAAATFTASEVEPDLSHSVAISALGTIGIITVTLLVLGFAILSSSVDRHFHTQRVELALARARMEFAYVARTASLGELAASIAHEINQPLGAVVNSASATERWLAMQPPNIAEAREAAAHVVREANRASEVIRRIRALLKKEKPAMEPLDLNEIIGEVLRMTGDEIAAADVSVQADLSESNPHALGDRVQKSSKCSSI
jgi:NO-binding membrane sensor protein with MHYT domain